MSKRIILLCSDCFSTRALYHQISKKYEISAVVMETPMRGVAILKRRIKKLGIFKVAGQVMFTLLVVPVVRFFSMKRIRNIVMHYEMKDVLVPVEKTVLFPSANDDACIHKITQLEPDIVIVNGTRILSNKLLNATKAVFINMHTGITPQYRGVHGGYWAVANNDLENCGVTIHLVDKGIDTGGIIYQAKVAVTPEDNFVTYPYLQFGAGIPLELKALDDIMNGTLQTVPLSGKKSALWSHPTIWKYLYLRIFKGKK